MAAVGPESYPGPNVCPRLGGWAWAGILLALLVVFYTGVVRYVDPVGEKYIGTMAPGGADFVYPFNGARALLAGVDPYTHDIPALFDPWWRDEPVNGVMFRQFYPPSHLAAYVPLALITDGNFRKASRLWFHLNLVCLVTISLVSCMLVARVLRRHDPPKELWITLFPGMLFILGTNQAVSLGLERGQSDIFTATLCWLACLAWLRGGRFLPMLLVVTASLLKGYALLFGFGLGVLGLLEARHRIAILAGATVPVLLLVVPVLNYFPRGFEASVHRAGMFWNTWFNHGFKNLVYQLSPELAEPGRFALAGLTGAIAVLLWWRLFRSEPDRQPVWLVLFCSVSLAAMLGLSALSVAYNLILVLPGVFIVLAGQSRLRQIAFLGGEAPLGLLLVFTGICFVLPRSGSMTFPIAAVGLLGIAAVGACVVLAKPRPSQVVQ